MDTYWPLGLSIAASTYQDMGHPWWLRVLIWVLVFAPLIVVGERIDEARKAARR